MEINSLLKKVIDTQSGNLFYRFSNEDGKIWLMPVHNMQVAMNLYQPSGRNGKMLKTLFPWIHRIQLVRSVIHAEAMQCALNAELKCLLEQLFQEADPEFAIFCGTPCVHQKITMQISKKKRILGYCKITDNGEIGAIFKREKLILDTLAKKGIGCIPECLYCDSQSNGSILFVQTTTKSKSSNTDSSWNRRNVSFLEELHEKTKQKILFEQTAFYQDLVYLKEHLNALPYLDITLIENCIKTILKCYQGKEVEFSLYHGDFTPWNMYVEKDKLFVFDFEYAKNAYPAFLDFFHFITQVGALKKHSNVGDIWLLYQKEKKSIDHLIKDTDRAYTCYLLSIISHYVKRESGIFNETIARNIRVWIGLLKCLNNST